MFEELDPLIDCIDASQSEMRVCRRSLLAGCLKREGVVLVTSKALTYVSQAAKFFDDIPIMRWMEKVFPNQCNDVEERMLRFNEEAMELGQAEGLTRDQMHALVDQVFDKPIGDPEQELGGTLVTLSAYMAVKGANGVKAFNDEFARINCSDVVKRIQDKHQNKLVVSSSQR